MIFFSVYRGGLQRRIEVLELVTETAIEGQHLDFK